jgi:two-component system OmpR family response regulator
MPWRGLNRKVARILPKVLTIEDDDTTASEIVRALVEQGFDVEHVGDGIEGLRRASTGAYDAITLDRTLPGLDGLSIASTLKRQGFDTPILMITAMNDVDERVKGLRAGGDDYLVKPFALEEMVARVEVLLRRKVDAGKLVLRYADLELDLVAHVARRGGVDLRLFPKEFKLLEMLVRNSEQVLTRTMIFETVWGYTFDPGTNLIDVHIGTLRKKLEGPDQAPLLHTVRGAGYRLSRD